MDQEADPVVTFMPAGWLMRIVIAILCVIMPSAIFGALSLAYPHQEAAKSTYVSPRFCYDEDDNFKSDVCSKIGKQWNL
jgi:hypothetical protein